MTVSSLLPYFLFWTIWFGLSNAFEYVLFKDRQVALASPYLNTANQLSNLIHAGGVILMGFYIMFFEFRLDGPLTFWQQELIAFSSTFFIVDTTALLLFRHHKIDVLIHHAIVLLGLAWIAHENSSGWILGSVGALGELGPCIYIEQIARRWNFRSEKFHSWNDALYLISFLLSRLVGLSFIYYISLFKTRSHLVLHILGAMFLALGVYWSLLLISRYARRYPSSFVSQRLNFMGRHPKSSGLSA